ncbi:MAG: T9SS type A sorting domain-containing protein [Phycisphaerae bacterium]|nr:T9SS type A sorting domain-containing protein [Saprospiraceae bacterium]
MSIKNYCSFLLCLLFANAIQAQNTSFFSAVSTEKIALAEGIAPTMLPKKFDAYQLDEVGIRAALESAPWEFMPLAAQSKCVISVPMGNGKIEAFSVWRVAMLDPEMAAACPYIRTYAGISLTDSRRTLRFSTTLRGFRALVMQPDFASAMLKPLFPGNQNSLYIAYDHADAPDQGQGGFQTGMAPDGNVWFGNQGERYAPAAEERGQELDPVKLKTFRFCVAAVGEFTQDHGGTKPLALSAVTEYTNMVSAVFERDIDIRLQLTFGTQYVMFTDPATDPYPILENGACMAMNPEVLNQYTNVNSYDVGHVFIRGGGGVAGGNACFDGKGRGCSAGMLSGPSDYGDFFLYVVGQEVGHQLGGGHTWNFCDAPGNGQRAAGTAFEPGSGTTIMSYAGCNPGLVQAIADLYYHAGSIEEIKNFAIFATCGTLTETTNHAPTVTLAYPDNFSIPISTPFELNGSASDPDGDALSYSWEGIDAGPETPLGAPEGNAAIFRSWPAVDVTNRYFPRLNTILANGFYNAEQLPTYTRDLTFRFTARDNKPNGGGVTWADVAFKSTGAAGPFLVVSPNSASAIWRVGELTQVLWDVANTNASPVNCQKVNIRLSTDGGQTYPIMLAQNTENDGSQYVLVPNNLTSTARARVEAADNVFFDLSNANFKIQNPVQPSLTLGLSADESTICLPDNFSTVVNTASVLGYNTPVALDLLGSLPPGATASFSATNLNPGESSTLSVNLQSVAVEGDFNFTVRAISGTDTMLRPVTLHLRRNDFTGFALQTPLDGSTNLGLAQTLHWGKGLDADNYDVQFSDSPSFTTILASSSNTTLDSLKINFLLEKGKAYFWRVRPRNECGVHPWLEPYFFSTYAENCLSFTANDLPKNFSTNGTPTIESNITVVQGGNISDIVVSNIGGYHEIFKELEAHLISPQGTDILLWKDKCGSINGSFNLGFSDASPSNFACPPNNGTIYKPQSPLAPLLGQNSAGIWILRVKDKVQGAGGTLSNFQLQFCQSINVQPPYLVNNIVMPLPTGANRAITPDFLLVEDPNNSHGQLTFTVVSVPQHGNIAKDGVGELKAGDQFTQADIDAGVIRFFDYGFSTDPDGFRFVVSDGEGGFLGTPMFVAQPFVGTQNIDFKAIDFSIFPNPAGSSVWVAFGQALESAARVSLFNMAGQLVRTENMSTGQERSQIDLAQLPKGIYVVRVETEAGAGVRKLVVE